MVIALVSTTIYFSEIVISNSAHLLRKCRSAVYLVYVCITSVYILRGLYVYGPTVIGINCRGARPRLLFCLNSHAYELLYLYCVRFCCMPYMALRLNGLTRELVRIFG